MAVVPQYNQPQVKDAALPSVRVPTSQPLESFGGGASLDRKIASEQRLANAILDPVEKIALEEQKKADDLAVLEADNKMSAKKTAMFWDTKDGAITKKGKDAFGVTNEYIKKYDDAAKEIEDSLSNDRQKLAFKKRALQYRDGFNSQLTQHTYKEYQEYDKEVTQVSLDTAKNDAVLNYNDPVSVAASMQKQQDVLQKHAADNGLPPEWLALKTQESLSSTHTAIIDRMLGNGDDLQAKKYYETNKDQFVAKDAVVLEKALEEGSLRGESRRQADLILSKNPNITMTQAIKEADKIEDTKLYDETVKRIRDEFTIKKAAQQQQEEQLFESAANFIEANKGTKKPPEKMWMALSLDDRNKLETRMERLLKGVDNPTKLEVYYDLVNLSTNPETSNEFLKKSLLRHVNDLSESDFKKIVDFQGSLRAKDGKANDELDSIRTRKDIVNEALESSGVDIKKNKDKVSVFRKQVDDEIAAHYRATGKKATTEDTQKIVDRLKVKALVKDGGWLWFDKEKELWQVEEGEEISISVKDLPKSDVKEIEDLLRKNKRAVNDDNILKVYNNVYGKGRKK